MIKLRVADFRNFAITSPLMKVKITLQIWSSKKISHLLLKLTPLWYYYAESLMLLNHSKKKVSPLKNNRVCDKILSLDGLVQHNFFLNECKMANTNDGYWKLVFTESIRKMRPNNFRQIYKRETFWKFSFCKIMMHAHKVV